MGQTWSATPWFTNPFWSKLLTLQVRTQSLKNMSAFCNCQHRSSDLLNPTLGFFYCFPTLIPTLLPEGGGWCEESTVLEKHLRKADQEKTGTSQSTQCTQ